MHEPTSAFSLSPLHSSALCPPHPQLTLYLLRPRMEPDCLLLRLPETSLLSSSRKLSLWSPAWGLRASELFPVVPPVQEVGNPICTQTNNLHTHGSSVADGEVTRIQTHLAASLYLEPASVTMHFLKLWLLQQQSPA